MDHDLPLPLSTVSRQVTGKLEDARLSTNHSVTGLVKQLKRSISSFKPASDQYISAALVFNIHTIRKSKFQGRTFTFRCSNSTDCLEWMEVLSKAVSKARRSSAFVSFHQKFQASSLFSHRAQRISYPAIVAGSKTTSSYTTACCRFTLSDKTSLVTAAGNSQLRAQKWVASAERFRPRCGDSKSRPGGTTQAVRAALCVRRTNSGRKCELRMVSSVMCAHTHNIATKICKSPSRRLRMVSSARARAHIT